MANKITKQPEIRFKEFNNDWEQRKFKDFSIKTGKKNSKGLDYPAYSVSNKDGLVIQSEQFDGSRLDNLDKSAYKFVEPGEFAYNPARINVGSIAFNNLESTVIVSSLYVVVKMSNLLDNQFILQYIKSPTFINEVKRNTEGSVREYLFFENFKNIKFPYTPNIEEQQKIGAFFKSLDDTIALQNCKLEEMQLYKKAMLQKMFPKNGEKAPEIRFDGYNDDWEQRKLGEVAKFNPKSQLPDEFEYVDLESVVGTSLISHRTENKENAPSRAQRLAKKGDVFYQTVRPYQKNNYLFDMPYDNYVFSTGYAQLRPHGDSYFLLSRIQEERFVSNVLDRSTGTSYPAINSTDLAQIDLTIPKEFEEQQKIGALFKSLDDTIALQNNKLNKLKEMKKVLLQKMFV
ncbi:restriction endonuclease subunit S [Vagococcus fluvialis]|uniref:restriction endonuclease subunit S n=1 Tax=Vagococcus fluvialis TaxID=2738 RepID=UPI003B21B0D8